MISNKREALRNGSLSATLLPQGCQLRPDIARFVGEIKRRRMMSYWQSLWLFLVMLVGIIALPGMDMALIVAHTLRSGMHTS